MNHTIVKVVKCPKSWTIIGAAYHRCRCTLDKHHRGKHVCSCGETK